MPSRSPLYDPSVALAFFESAGKREKVPAGTKFFTEDEKNNRIFFHRDKMYLLVEGEVSLAVGHETLGTVTKGQIFGEMTAITQLPRSATALAKTDCSVIALDDKQFRAALAKQPAFALMLMSIMVGRLRETIGRLRVANALQGSDALEQSAAFDPKRLAELVAKLSDDPPAYFDRRKPIVQEGQAGTRMYVVLEGTVAVVIGGKVVERLGPGGVFGELALIEQQPRLASVNAETDCSVQPVNRASFLALVESSPEFAALMLTKLAERLRNLTSRLR
ncbi:MAG TPA: cyclic nucleotide-binding domain-containing protein [Burkholderiales bacterium]|jgi:CRP/FNR family cyclic AMP-dependent transcriptional regulator|nr:cyclic nucleotide-binding domain-containing protein [Burkholderiales bacterium]